MIKSVVAPCKSIVCLENARYVCFCKADRLRDLCKARTKRRYFPKTVRLSIWCASAGKICWHCTGNTSDRSILRRQERARCACIYGAVRARIILEGIFLLFMRYAITQKCILARYFSYWHYLLSLFQHDLQHGAHGDASCRLP